MIANKTITLIALVMLLLPFLSNAGIFPYEFQYGSEPDGFRGIKWGQDISTLKDMTFTENLQNNNNRFKLYIRNSDSLMIGSAQMTKIQYCFWGGKFYFASAFFKGKMNWEALKKSCFKIFGGQKTFISEMKGTRKNGSRYEERHESYDWGGRKTSLSIDYSYSLNFGSLSIVSVVMQEKSTRLREKGAREREGF